MTILWVRLAAAGCDDSPHDFVMRRLAGIVDVCLIPEVPFRLDGDTGLLAYVDKVLSERGHCVLCVAEGAGQVCRTSPETLQLPVMIMCSRPSSRCLVIMLTAA